MALHKLLLDTDIGNDIDDMFALAYLLSREDVDLLGVSTVTGQPQNRAKLASVLCALAGKEIPIHAGCENPLLVPLRQTLPNPTESPLPDRYPHKDDFAPNTAVEFLRRTIEENPGQVTLAAIGPLTNIALLFSVYPHIPSLLKSLVIMGGKFASPEDFDTRHWGVSEWNILCDPHAAAIVFNARPQRCYVTGIEITYRFGLPNDSLSRNLMAHPLLKPVAEAIAPPGCWDAGVYFHDVLALCAALDAEDYTWRRGTVSADPQTAETILTPDPSGCHFVLKSADTDAFFRHYAEVLHCAM